jgi:HAD superfamily hydrolase (TIGR01450 family)
MDVGDKCDLDRGYHVEYVSAQSHILIETLSILVCQHSGIERMLTAPVAAQGYLIDLDGTLLSGDKLLPGARELIEHAAGRFVVLSNDSEHTPAELSARFDQWGIAIDSERFILAGTFALEALARRGATERLMLLGSPSLRAYARNLGFRVTSGRADSVLVARDRRFTYAKLAAAAQEVVRGAGLAVACPDTTHPDPTGLPVPEAGALAAALLACTGSVPVEVFGKPSPGMFQMACARLGIAPKDGLMIGDNPATDGKGAEDIGMPFYQIQPIPEPEGQSVQEPVT